MIIKILLTAGLLGALTYSLVQRAPMRIVKISMGTIVSIGIYFVWVPEHTNAIADLIGVGRGADLVFYCWILVTLIIVLNLYLKTRRLDAAITKLARQVALDNANPPVDTALGPAESAQPSVHYKRMRNT